jgi:hypothetical protein
MYTIIYILPAPLYVRNLLLRIDHIYTMASIGALTSSGTLSANVIPLGLIRLVIDSRCCQFWDFRILDLLWDDQIEYDREERGYGKTSLHDELDGIEEAS